MSYFGVAVVNNELIRGQQLKVNGIMISKRKNKILVGHQPKALSYSEVQNSILNVKNFLLELGVKEKDINGVYNFI